MNSAVVVLAANAAVAALLINSGAAKLVLPRGLRGALRDVASIGGNYITDGIVRLVAVAELATAVALLIPTTRIPASAIVAVFGTAFGFLGVAGVTRGSTIACGCFGRTSDKPLGWTNVLIGLVLLPVVLLNAVATGVGRDYTSNAVVLTALGSLVMCLWLNHRIALNLLAWRARTA